MPFGESPLLTLSTFSLVKPGVENYHELKIGRFEYKLHKSNMHEDAGATRLYADLDHTSVMVTIPNVSTTVTTFFFCRLCLIFEFSSSFSC